MPRPGPRRPVIPVRLAQDGIEWLATEAKRLGVSRSDVIRAALAHYATLPARKREIPKEK